MPYPRRVIIYLREKGIPSSLVTVVPVSDPQLGDKAPSQYPPRPAGSLPILSIPNATRTSFVHVRQSIAIMYYLEELCEAGHDGFPKRHYSMRGVEAFSRARNNGLLDLGDECTTAWNPIRTFGSGAGTMSIPAASKEMTRWLHRTLAAIENWFQDAEMSSHTARGETTIAEIVLYQFLEFTKDYYGKDMSLGTGESVVKDVYGRDAVQQFPRLHEFYNAFSRRDSARRDPAVGEVPSEEVLAKMTLWATNSM